MSTGSPGVDPAAQPPAYRIETERVVLRPWDPAEAAGIAALVGRNVPHLAPWMDWAQERPGVDAQLEVIRSFRAKFDADEEYVYGVFLDAGRPVGGTGLHPRVGPRAMEIGYWVDADHEGRGLVTEWVAALCRVGFAVHDLERIDIHCDPANTRSAAVPERLGFTLEAVLRRRLPGPDDTLRDTMVWTLFRDEADLSEAEVRAFDALGRRLL